MFPAIAAMGARALPFIAGLGARAMPYATAAGSWLGASPLRAAGAGAAGTLALQGMLGGGGEQQPEGDPSMQMQGQRDPVNDPLVMALIGELLQRRKADQASGRSSAALMQAMQQVGPQG